MNRVTKEAIDACCEILKPKPKEDFLIKIGTSFLLEDIESIKNMGGLAKLSPYIESNPTYLSQPYLVEIKRYCCGTTEHLPTSKAGLLRWIKGDVPNCSRCYDFTTNRFGESQASKAARLKWESERPIRTERFVQEWLTPNLIPSWKNPYSKLSNDCFYCDSSSIGAYIKSMNYRLFLKTPYWKAVAYKIKKKADFRCNICNSSENISCHHRNYSLHGFEHTCAGLSDLTCICDSCHKKHHGIEALPS